LALTAIDDWVRGRWCVLPPRTAAHCGQLQFHWGKPPPAAEPNTWIFTSATSKKNRVERGKKLRRRTGRWKIQKKVCRVTPTDGTVING